MILAWHGNAREDLRIIMEFYRDIQAHHYARDLLDCIERAERLLQDNPEAGQAIRKHIPSIRQWRCLDYWIFYYVDEQHIEIQNLVHTSRQLGDI